MAWFYNRLEILYLVHSLFRFSGRLLSWNNHHNWTVPRLNETTVMPAHALQFAELVWLTLPWNLHQLDKVTTSELATFVVP